MRITAILSTLLTVALATIGCEPSVEERVPVAGTVLLDGEPLPAGTIRFVPDSGRPASSAILADGSFELASESVSRASAMGIPRGKYRVEVSASEVVDDETIRWIAPARYADFRTSGLEVTIQEPTEDLVVDLTWEGADRPGNNDRSTDGDNPPNVDESRSPPPARDPSSSGVHESGNES
jgi:hypothetical protein